MAEPDLSRVTRADRAVTDEGWICAFLSRAQTGTLATAVLAEDGQPQPFLRTQLFVFDAHRRAIYLHGARKGRLFNDIQANDRVCFIAAEMGALLPAKTAFNFSVAYASVVVFGRLRLVDDPQEAGCALQMLLDKYFPQLRPGVDYRPATQAEREVTAVYRLDISEWSGKKKSASG